MPLALLGDPGEAPADVDGLLGRLGVLPTHDAATTAADADPADLRVPASDERAAAGRADAGADRPGGRIFASPLARRLADEAGVPLSDLVGTGPGGRIVRRDVDAAATRARPIASPEPAVVATAGRGHTDLPHSRIRRATANRLVESKQTTPHFYLRGSAQVDTLVQVRESLNRGGPVRVSVNDLVVMAAARAHLLVPDMNVIWLPDAIRTFDSVDLAVAVATDRGLVTPVLRSVEQMRASEVARTMQDLTKRAREVRLQADELEGGTCTVTNLGMFGTEEFAAIINPPQSAILAVGAIRAEPVAREGSVTVADILRVTLSVDHRPIDGVVAAQWLRVFLSLLEDPVQLLA